MRHSSTLAAALTILSIATFANADPSAVSRLGWVTDGDVRAAVQVGNTLYVGGTFTRVGPTSGALGSLFGVSPTTGERVPNFPLVDGVVNTVEPDGGGGYYIGGSFTMAGGVPRDSLAHVLSDGSVDPTFAPVIRGGAVFSLRLGTSFLFVGGDFNNVNGTFRDDLAALNPTTGALITFPVFLNGQPQEILIVGDNVIVLDSGILAPARAVALNQVSGAAVWTAQLTGIADAAVIAGSRLIVGGRLLSSGGTLASVDVATGVLDATWNPSGAPPLGSADSVTALAVSGDTLYVGGSFTAFGGQARTNAAAVDVPTGAVTSWTATTDSTISSLAISPGGGVFIGGNFTEVNGQPREDFAEVNAGGTLTAWVADAYSSGTRSLSLIAGMLVVGSHLGVSGGSARTNLAAFDLSANTLLPWAPAISDTVMKFGAVGGTIYIGASRLAPSTPQHLRNLVFAVHATSGAVMPWTPPPAASGHTLIAARGSHVYVSGAFTTFTNGIGVRRLDPITGVADPSWFARLDGQIAITEGTMYSSSAAGISVVDLATGTPDSPWDPEFAPQLPIPAIVDIKGMAVDGRTLYVAVQTLITSNLSSRVDRFDRVSRTRIQPVSPSSPGPAAAGNTIGAIAVADGQLIIANSFYRPGLPAPLPRGVSRQSICSRWTGSGVESWAQSQRRFGISRVGHTNRCDRARLQRRHLRAGTRHRGVLAYAIGRADEPPWHDRR